MDSCGLTSCHEEVERAWSLAGARFGADIDVAGRERVRGADAADQWSGIPAAIAW